MIFVERASIARSESAVKSIMPVFLPNSPVNFSFTDRRRSEWWHSKPSGGQPQIPASYPQPEHFAGAGPQLFQRPILARFGRISPVLPAVAGGPAHEDRSHPMDARLGAVGYKRCTRS